MSLILVGIVALTALTGCSRIKLDSELNGAGTGNTCAAEGKDVYTEEVKIAFLPNVIGDS